MTEAPTAPAYLCWHAEFHPGPSVMRLQERAGIAHVGAPGSRSGPVRIRSGCLAQG
jgi:hypothetical protein